ncbi:MAG: anti-anti-sigma factor [Acidimicrobiales bacterium]|nr:anti-anti-sigma factor [Acidimicrobiales bacterium]
MTHSTDPVLTITVAVAAGGHVVVRPAGEVDAATAPELLAALLGACSPQLTVLEVDMAGVAFLDSAGISALLAGRARAAEHGARFTVSNVQPVVRRVLDVTGLSETFLD